MPIMQLTAGCGMIAAVFLQACQDRPQLLGSAPSFMRTKAARRRDDQLASGARGRDGLLRFWRERGAAAHEVSLQLRNASVAFAHLVLECRHFAAVRARGRILPPQPFCSWRWCWAYPLRVVAVQALSKKAGGGWKTEEF
ncbi:hypothetical protein [Janthinobacterium rivuli]|uniref:hypothetical protein n=1 Tax=Janthinobacterium rivuli TaxID=2751478 RepID=UPI00383AAEB7